MNKKYKLLKDLPGTKAGTIFTENYGDDTYEYNSDNGEDCRYRRNFVEMFPEWFEQVVDRIEVVNFQPVGDNGEYFWYEIKVNTRIPEDKLPLIKQPIENVLNDDVTLNTKFVTNLVENYGAKFYTQTDLDNARREAFEAARGTMPFCEITKFNYKFEGFESYLNTLKEKQ